MLLRESYHPTVPRKLTSFKNDFLVEGKTRVGFSCTEIHEVQAVCHHFTVTSDSCAFFSTFKKFSQGLNTLIFITTPKY